MTEFWDVQSFKDEDLFNNSVDIDSLWNTPDFMDFIKDSGMFISYSRESNPLTSLL